MTQLSQPAARSRARTLSEALKTRDRAGLTDLLSRRPDLAYPMPLDLAELSSRAGTVTSIARALDQLNVWLRQVAEGLAALPDPSSVSAVAELIDADRDQTAEAVAELRELALLWGEDDQLHLVRGVREYFEPYPGGLAPPSARPLTESQITAALAECGDEVHGLLDRLLWAPTGAVRNAERKVSVTGARSPVEQLLARQLLRPLDADTVILPREVSLQLRRGRFSEHAVSVSPPTLTGRTRNPALVDKAAAGAAFGLLHDVELAAHSLESAPHRLLRTGGLGARDMTLLARNLSTDAAHASFVMECASIAGLVAPGSNLTLLPTAEFDRWAARDAASQWRGLVQAWLTGGRHYSRSVEPGAHVLGPEAEAPNAAVLRRLVLRLAAQAGVGTMVDLDQLTEAVGWHYPRAARSALGLTTLVGWVWREATWLGLNSLGATSSYAPALLDSDQPLPPALMDLFPTPVERIIVQADLTAVAPGPLPHALASDLRLLADQESRGGGGVFRFSAASLRRGFEAGWSSDNMHAWLDQHSTTGVPQPLAYLIDDMARQYGSIRVGSVASYLRVEDSTQAAALLAAPEAAALGLRTIAPGVLAATAEAHELVDFLRLRGHSPAVEDETGSTVSTPPQPRAPSPVKDRSPQPPSAAEVADSIAAVETRRRELRGTEPPTPPRPSVTTEETLRELQLATMDATAVQVTYVTADGQLAKRDLNPVDLAAGALRAVDPATTQVVNIPLARISSVGPVVEGN
ncbi:MAG: helicase-associated domain-containing protein [Propionibacteriaceae bacterium]